MNKKEIIEKEFMDGLHSGANSGIHEHFLIRQELMTMTDGSHKHWFVIPSQDNKVVLAWTYWDGNHRHTLEQIKDDITQEGASAHKHVVYIPEDLTLPDGTEIKAGEVFITEKDGEHEHGADSLHSTNKDGSHEHILRLSEKTAVRSLNVEEIIDLMLLNQPIDTVIEKQSDIKIDEDRQLALALLGYSVEKEKKKKPYQMSLDKQERTEIQSLIFPKGKFTESQAKDFLDRNDFKRSKIDENESSFRFRQKNPEKFKRFRTITLPGSDGVKAVIGVRKENDSTDVDMEKIMKSVPEKVTIGKTNDEKRIVYGVVLEPEVIDAQGDIISAEEIEVAAHKFMKESRKIKFRHRQIIKEVKPVESFIAPADLTFEGPNGKQKVKKGSWVLGVHVDDDKLWAAVKKKALNAFSVGGVGLRTPLAS